MKGQSGWSYSPYRPFLTETGDLYVCRIAPTENSIHIEWLDTKEDEYNVFVRRRGAEFFDMAGKTRANEFEITGLDQETDYEFFCELKVWQKPDPSCKMRRIGGNNGKLSSPRRHGILLFGKISLLPFSPQTPRRYTPCFNGRIRSGCSSKPHSHLQI